MPSLDQTIDDALEDRALETAELDAKKKLGEPLAYQRHSERSFYFDMALRQSEDSDEKTQAIETLERHARQMADIPLEKRSTLPGAEYEYRTNPNTTTGQGLEFAPPLWLNEMWAGAARPGECILRLAPEFVLPPGVSSVNLPRMTAGTSASVQPLQPSVVDDMDIETATVKSPAAIFAGMSDWSIQSFEQSPQGAHVDHVVFQDLSESLIQETEKALIVGSGENEQFYGLYNLPKTNTITFTEGSPKGTAAYPKMSEALAQVSVKRGKQATALLMSGGRLNWLVSQEDTVTRPLALFENIPGSNFPLVSFTGYGVYLDDAIPNTLGSGKEQDTIIACRPEDFVILHSPIRTAILTDVLSGTLQVRFRLHRTTAALLGRYPSGISVVSGTGLVAQVGFK